MEEFLAKFSKNSLAAFIIGAGILFIVVSDPPKTVCDAQVESFKKKQKGFLYIEDSKSKYQKTPTWKLLLNQCKAANTPGGCYDYFSGFKQVLEDLEVSSKDCLSGISELKEVRENMDEFLDLIVKIHWGDEGGKTRSIWLSAADFSLYCEAKAKYERYYGKESWNKLREKHLNNLSQAKALGRDAAWKQSLFSENCAKYPW